MKQIYLLLFFIAFLYVGCTPVAEKPKKDKAPLKPAEKIQPEIVEEAQILRHGPPRISTKPYTPGTVLLETAWKQGFPFNKRLPKLGKERVIAGCVNTALAQVLYYYRYPLSTRGIIVHQWKGRQLAANLYKNYNWDIVPAKVTANTPEHQIDELAALFLNLGIVNGTKFNIASKGGSGASFNVRALAENFRFSTKIKTLENDDAAFLQTIKREIDQRKVVLLSISGKPSGHMAVIDGYRQDSDGIKSHLNMGWGGSDDDFYDLTKTISPKSKNKNLKGAPDFTFYSKMTIYYNLIPCHGSDCYQNLEVEDQIHGLKIRGKFNANNDKDVYSDLFLNGPTVFKGDRGYSNQAFYIKVFDEENRLLVAEAPKAKTFRINLIPGKYNVEISLCKKKQDGETCYGHDPKYLDYKVDIETNTISLAEKQRILTRDKPPELDGKFSDMILKKGFDKLKIRIDAADPDADPLVLRVFTAPQDSNLKLALRGNILSITPNKPVSNTTSKITVQAVSKGKIDSKSFHILFSATSVAFGREFDTGGIFVGQNNRNRHKVILQGNCIIQGDNGRKNQAFYINLIDSAGRKRFKYPMDSKIRSQFARGIYYLESMLEYSEVTKDSKGTRTSTKSYKYKKGIGDTYNINVSCPDFDESIVLLEKDNRDVPPKIVTTLRHLILGLNFPSIHPLSKL